MTGCAWGWVLAGLGMERDGSVANAAKSERTLPIAAGENRSDGSLRVVASASGACKKKSTVASLHLHLSAPAHCGLVVRLPALSRR